MLQSTMNSREGIGVISQATLYAFFCASAVLLPKFFINRFGSKNTSVAAMLAYLPYIASNYYPHWSFMIPSSILLGIAGPLLWASYGVYLNGLSILHSGQGESAVEESVSYKPAEEDIKKSCDGTTRKKCPVPNAAGNCAVSKYGESEETSLQSRERLNCDTSVSQSQISNVVPEDSKHGESKEVSSSQSRNKLDCDTSMMQLYYSNVPSKELKYSESKETSLQLGKSLDCDTFMVQSNIVSEDSKHDESKKVSCLQSRNGLVSRDISRKRYHCSNFLSNELKYDESKKVSSLQSHERVYSRDIAMMQSRPSEMPSGSWSYKKSCNSIQPSSSEHHDSRVKQNSKNIPFEGSSEENETKKLVAKPTSSLISCTTAKFFGFHGMAHLTSHVWSSLLSYFTLKTQVFSSDFGNSSCRCGAEYCSAAFECFESTAGIPGASVRTILTSVCACMCLVSILIVAVFLDSLDREKRVIYFSFDFLIATCAILKRKEMLLLIPLSIHTGLVQGFYVGDFNKSYVACAWGTYHVGLVAACYGVWCGVSSLLSGWCVRQWGRRPVFIFAAVVNLVSVAFLLLWVPHSNIPNMFFIASALWGIHVGTVWSQLRALYGVLFASDEEAAFSAFHLWSGLGFCAAFGFSNFFCIYHKLFVILVVSVLGFSGYYAVEFHLLQE